MKTSLLKTVVAAMLIFVSINAKAFTAVTSGNWSNPLTWGGVGPGSNPTGQDIDIPSGITVTLDVNVTFTSLVLNTFNVDGTLSSTQNFSVEITSGTFTGSGTVNIDRLVFSGLLTNSTYNGILIVDVLQNTGSSFSSAGTTTVNDSLLLEGGTITLANGGNLNMAGGSHVVVDGGMLASTGGQFNSTGLYNVLYLGASVNTGIEVTGGNLSNFKVALATSAQSITITQSQLTISGNLQLINGNININGNELIVSGNLLFTAGQIQSTGNSELTINGTGNVTSDLSFTTGSSLRELTINRNGAVGLETAVIITNGLHLMQGTFELNTGGSLAMGNNSTIYVVDGEIAHNNGSFNGALLYNIEYSGGSVNSSIETAGSGLNNVLLDLNNTGDSVSLGEDMTVAGDFEIRKGRMALSGNDLTLNGTMDLHTNNGRFIGNGNSELILNLTTTNDTIRFAGAAQLDRLVLNMPVGGMLTLGNNLTINDELSMVRGKFDLYHSTLTIDANGDIIGYNQNRYMVTSDTGKLERNLGAGASAYSVFPIGTMNEYTPFYGQQNSTGSSGMFQARSMPGVFSNGTTGMNIALTEGVVNNTWLITSSAVVISMNMKLGWEVSNEVNGFDRTNAYISHYIGNNWDSYQLDSADLGPHTTFELTRDYVTSLSPFAVIDAGSALSIVPVFENALTIFPNPTIDYITIELGNEAGDVFTYELFDAEGKLLTSLSNAETRNMFDFTAYQNGFYMIRITNTVNKTVVTKRIIKS